MEAHISASSIVPFHAGPRKGYISENSSRQRIFPRPNFWNFSSPIEFTTFRESKINLVFFAAGVWSHLTVLCISFIKITICGFHSSILGSKLSTAISHRVHLAVSLVGGSFIHTSVFLFFQIDEFDFIRRILFPVLGCIANI